jgi:hypothetical protein
VLRSLHQQGSQIRIAFLADVHLRLALSRFPASRLQSQIAAHVATLAEAMRIFQRQQECQCDQRDGAKGLGTTQRLPQEVVNPHWILADVSSFCVGFNQYSPLGEDSKHIPSLHDGGLAELFMTKNTIRRTRSGELIDPRSQPDAVVLTEPIVSRWSATLKLRTMHPTS